MSIAGIRSAVHRHGGIGCVYIAEIQGLARQTPKRGMLDERESSLTRPSSAIFEIEVMPSDFKLFQLLPPKNTHSFSNDGTNIISLLSFPARVAPSYSLPLLPLSYH